MIKVEVIFRAPLFNKTEGLYIDCLHPDAWEWFADNVGSCNFERDSEPVYEVPPLTPGCWDIVHDGLRVIIRLQAVMFKLRWSDNLFR